MAKMSGSAPWRICGELQTYLKWLRGYVVRGHVVPHGGYVLNHKLGQRTCGAILS